MIERLENLNEEEQEKILHAASDEKKQADFYQKLREKVQNYIKKHPNSKYINYLVATPDFFHLCCRLMTDGRVPIKNKVYIAAAITYFISPIDIITDAIPGIGFADDLLIVVRVISSLLNSVDEAVIKEHWAGDGDVIEKMQQLLDTLDGIVGKGVLKKITRFFR